MDESHDNIEPMSRHRSKSISNEPQNKIDILLLNNAWNDKNERLIISIGENAASYKWMHEKSHSKYKLYNKILSILTIVLNGALSTQTLYNEDDSVYNLILIQRIFIYTVTLLSIVNNFLKLQELSIKHLNASSQYAVMYHDIQQQMCMYRKDRANAVKYVHDMLKNSDNIRISSPDIDKNIINEFKKKFQNTDISVPDIADKIQKIDIITEPRGSSFSHNNCNGNGNDNMYESAPISHLSTNPAQMTNLSNMNAFKIDGDLDENDEDILHQYLKKKALDAQANFEYRKTFNI